MGNDSDRLLAWWQATVTLSLGAHTDEVNMTNYIQTDEFCIKHDELCIRNDESCIEMMICVFQMTDSAPRHTIGGRRQGTGTERWSVH